MSTKSYQSWFNAHGEKHKKIVDKLTTLSDIEVIDYFSYENMKVNEEDFCVLYKQNKKCHDIENLNCYLCACPNFRVEKIKSFCAINSKYGAKIETANFTHQDCSKCTIPHQVPYIRKYFSRDWFKIMGNTFS